VKCWVVKVLVNCEYPKRMTLETCARGLRNF